MFTVYFLHRESSLTALYLNDDHLRDQLWETENVLEILRQGNDQSKLLVYRMFRGYDMFLLRHLWQLTHEAQRRGLCGHGAEDPYLRQHAAFQRHGIPLVLKEPRWVGASWLYESHRSQVMNLEDPGHYTWRFPRTPLLMPCLYPQNIPGGYDFTVTVTLGDRRRLEVGERVIPPPMIDKYKHLSEAFS